MKYPRVWEHKGDVWYQETPDANVLHVYMVPGERVSRSTFTPDQLSVKPVEVEQTQAQEQQQ